VTEPHPLFLPDEDEEPIVPIRISITRVVDGREESIGVALAADEIQSLEQIAERFGGGHYTLKARDERVRVIKGGVRRYLIPPDDYPPRPLVVAPMARRAAPPAPPAPPVQAAPVPAPAAPPAAAPSESIFALLLQQQRDAAAAQAAMQRESSAQQAQLLAQMLASAEKRAELAQAQAAQIIQSMATMKTSEAEAAKGHDPLETFLSGMKFATETQAQNAPPDQIETGIMAFLSGFAQRMTPGGS